jgi:hypothetical protein
MHLIHVASSPIDIVVMLSVVEVLNHERVIRK